MWLFVKESSYLEPLKNMIAKTISKASINQDQLINWEQLIDKANINLAPINQTQLLDKAKSDYKHITKNNGLAIPAIWQKPRIINSN